MNKRIVKLLLKSLNKPLFFLGLLLSSFGTAMGLLIPQIIGKLLDNKFLVELISDYTSLSILVLFFFAVYIIQAVSSYIIGLCGSKSLNRLQKYIYSSLLKSKVRNLDDFQSGDISSRLTNDMSSVLNFITVLLPNFLLNVLVVVGSAYYLFKLSTPMAMMSLSILPILLFIIVPINNKLETTYTDYQEELGEISSRISHKFTNMRLVKAFQGEQQEETVMGTSFDRLTASFKKIIGFSSIQNALVNSLMMAFIIMMLVVAGMEVSKGAMTMSTLTTFFLYMTQLIDPVTDISSTIGELAEFNSVSNRLIELIDLDKESHDTYDKVILDSNIRLNNVNFAYEQENVLNDMSVTVESGKHVAIVGPSGAGKSTIFSLLMKFYQDYDGEISIGNRNLSELSEEQIRNMIAYIPQDNTLFHGSIKDNLLYGKNQSVSEERINEVLKELGLTKLVNDLENGLDTEISDSGTGLSEGQKQRFNIARALLLEHPIYLLDEVTASLDSVTERIISKAIDKLTAGKTRLTIAHRLHTVKEADSILVLDKGGQVVDFGTHNQLIDRNKLYNEFLVGLQQAS
ncbi:TPA: ABC transporter ATP-binding protein [Streptococcus agalactiae]|nr:ABC transporter ATP-binding protein [Streptococcus agalactiae]